MGFALDGGEVMDENFDATYITITDEEGNDHEVEFISRITVDGND